MDIVNEVKKLNLPDGQYVVFGSGILAAKGIRPARDIDLLVLPELFKQLQKNGWKRKYFFRRVLTCKLITHANVEAFSHAYHGRYRTSVEELIQSAEIINGVPFMNLNELKNFKVALGRPKDLKDAMLINKYIQRH